jgi:asparagine synthase (glutamine-hydrolysing)
LTTTEVTRRPLTLADDPWPSWVAAFSPHAGGAGVPPLQLATRGDGATLAVDGPYRVVFDGWLYNRAELSRAGGGPADASDAMAVLHAYRALGHDVVGHIKGRFALLIWDGRGQKLVCARDPLGTYPLFWARRDEEVLFSTGMDELVRQPGVSNALNRVVLAEHLCSRWPEMADTHYEAVHRVPPGHVFALGSGGHRLYRYWDPVPEPDSDDWVPEDQLERFDDLFDQAVRRCLEPGPAGVFLSGGLDSVSVAAVATDLSRHLGMPDPWALSLGYPHPDCNEEDVQRQVAAKLGVPQVMLGYDEAVGGKGRVAAAAELSRTNPAPLLGLWPPAYRQLAREGKERGCKVILTGSGGDEMLLASTYRAADLLRRLDLPGIWRLYRSIQRSYPWPTLHTMRATFWSAAARPLLQRGARKGMRAISPSRLSARWRRKIAEGTPGWVRRDPELWPELLARAERRTATWPPLSTDFYYHECRSALDHVTVSMELERVYEDGRRVGIPIHEPYWDAELQEFLYRVPPDLLEQGGRTKGLVRGMLARRFPDAGFERQKKVIGNEFAFDTFVDEVPQVLAEMGGASALAELGIVDQAELDRAVARMQSDPGERRGSYRLWHVVGLEAWVRDRAHG